MQYETAILCDMIGPMTWWHMAIFIDNQIALRDRRHVNAIVEQLYCELHVECCL